MKKAFVAVVAAVAVVAGSLSLAGCTREGDSSLGMGFIPENQRFEMRHKSFYAGKVKHYDIANKEYVEEDGHRFFETTLFRTDSLVSSNLQTGYAGVQNSSQFGKRTAGFASDYFFYYAQVFDSEKGIGYLPIFDSITMDLTVSDYGGDTLRAIKYEVYEILSSMSDTFVAVDGTGSDDDDDDATKVSYINHDMSTLYDPSKPLFTFTFPDVENGVYTTSTAVKMTPADMSADGLSWKFVKRLMMVSDDPDWDGYASDYEIYQDDEKWLEEFRGLYIKPVDDLAAGEEGGIYAFDLSSSGFSIYGRTRNPDEPRLVKDTISLRYTFYDSEAAVSNTSINTVEHDFAGSELANMQMLDAKGLTADENRKSRTQTPTGYVDGMGGAATEIYLTDDLLNELRSISAEEGFDIAAINQALLYVYLDGAGYDWTQLDPGTFTPLLDAATPRVGLYTDYVRLTPVTDYDYVYEAQYDISLDFGGNLSRSLCCYVMDISSYMQRLKLYVDQLNPDNEPDFEYVFDAEDENYVSRTLYLGPEAYGFYGFKRVKVQGMDSELNNASMRLELTYTMMK